MSASLSVRPIFRHGLLSEVYEDLMTLSELTGLSNVELKKRNLDLLTMERFEYVLSFVQLQRPATNAEVTEYLRLFEKDVSIG
jgi:hypothetical protein